MKVAVIGLGYVGVPVAAVLASKGFRVAGVDIDPRKVEKVAAGASPLEGDEPGLEALIAEGVASGRLEATTDYGTLADANVVIASVETPIDDATHDPEYKALRSALRSIAPRLHKGVLVSIESTLAPGTMAGVVRPILERGSGLRTGRDFYLVPDPERVTAGKILFNPTTLDRAIVYSESRARLTVTSI